MLPATKSSYAFVDCLASAGDYFLSEVRLNIPESGTLVLTAKLNGPLAKHVWARAWVSNNIDGTLAEAVSPQMLAGDQVSITVKLNCEKVPDRAYLRIESAPLNTEHVVAAELM